MAKGLSHVRSGKFEVTIHRSENMLVSPVVFASKKIWNALENNAISQLADAARLPGVARVFGTPDLHVGYGVPIGCVTAMRNAVIPAAVGYDVNCGMRLMTTPRAACDVDMDALAHSVARDVPLGEGRHNVRVSKKDLDKILESGLSALPEVDRTDHRAWEGWEDAETERDMAHSEDSGSMKGDPAAVSTQAKQRGISQFGTLGGGNHFIEFQVVESIHDEEAAKRFGLFEGQLVIMIHSGSRGLGHQVGGEYMKTAASMTKKECPNAHLCYMPADSREGRSYVGAMNAAANFAFANRQFMTALVRRNIRHFLGDVELPLVYDVPHNMAKKESHEGETLWVHRKGATRVFDDARMINTPFEDSGQPALIPGSMGTASYLMLPGEEAAKSLYSVNHGAGRVMSRTQAAGRTRKGRVVRPPAISDKDLKSSMEGIRLVCYNKRSVREEAPGAYKDIDLVAATVTGAKLGRVVARMLPRAVLKG